MEAISTPAINLIAHWLDDMAAVSQRIPNFLGGVSQQTDDQKFVGQVRDIINGYPEPTFGLLKRPGAKYVAQLRDNSNNLINPTVLNTAKFCTIFQDATDQYLIAIIGGQSPTTNNEIKVWRLSDGAPITVAYGTNAKNYLSSASKLDYEVLTINDYTFITNKTTVVAAQANPSFTYAKVATIKVNTVEYSAQYKVVINGNTAAITTRNSDTVGTTPVRVLNYEDIITDLKTAIDALSISGLTVTKTGATLELTSTNIFAINGIGGKGGEGLTVYQDSISSIARLPNQSANNRIVRVINSEASEDDYYLKFIATTAGDGYWEETRAPDVSPGLQASTMPHQLVKQLDGTFLFSQITWEERLTGDITSNPNPSFVGNTIQQIFFYNNRLGMLSGENVVFSQSGDYFNFFSQSATTLVASDPIDISASSTRPAILYAALPAAQGLVLFSRTQQFIVTSDNGVFTPTGVSIKTISNYEMASDMLPVDMGTTVSFVTKTSSYTRVFEMETRGSEDSPIVVDISRVVPEWIPSTTDQLISSPQNSLLSLGSATSKVLYMFRFYTTGEKRELQSWFKWQLSGNLHHHAVNEDTMWLVTKQEDAFVLQRVDLVQSPDVSAIQTKGGISVDPRLDMWSLNPSRTYNSTTDVTKLYLPYKHDSTLSVCVVSGKPITVGSTFLDIGLITIPSTVLTDGGGDYVNINGRDLTGDQVFVGYLFDLTVELPEMYVRSGENKQISDLASSVVISRMQVNTGLGGDFEFMVRARGRDVWDQAYAVTDANLYLANDVPLSGSKRYTLPLHQKSTNMTIKLVAAGPFPVSLLSLVWEGHYSPRYYKRGS